MWNLHVIPYNYEDLRNWKQEKLSMGMGEKLAVTMGLSMLLYITLFGVGGVWAVAYLSPREIPGISCAWLGEGEQAGRVGWSCRLVFFQSLPHSSIRSPKRWGGRTFPDHSRHSEQYGGKNFKSAMKSGPRLYNTWSQGRLGLLCLCNDSKTQDRWRISWPLFNIT